MRLKYILNTFCVCISMFTYAQTPKQYFTIESPNSSALKSALESPVSLNTGKTGVTIPLYSVKQKDLEVPIVLSYSSGGVKLDVHPGWVGSNWNLNAGGVVTRNVKGIPDELYWKKDFVITAGGNNSGTELSPYGYVWNLGNGGTNWNTTQRITDLAKAGMDPNTLWVEAEPDEFVFDCGKYSGKFFLSHTGELRVQGQPDIKVEGNILYNIPLFDSSKPLNPNDPSTFTSVVQQIISYDQFGNPNYLYQFNRVSKAYLMGFKITTPDGIQYEYGHYDEAYDPSNKFRNVEFTAGMFDQFYFDEIFTTWHLKKITTPNGETIDFLYEVGNPILQVGTSFSFYKAGGSAKGFLGFIFGDVSSYTQEAKQEQHGRFIRPVYLKSITSKDVVVEFSRSTTTELDYNFDPIALQILDRSKYYSKNVYSPFYSRFMLGTLYENPNPYLYPPQVVKYSDKSYSIIRYDGLVEDLYFSRFRWEKLNKITVKSRYDNSIVNGWFFLYNNKSSERLQLLSLQELGKNNQALNPYKFYYDVSKILPSYNSFKIDHWGYYNGRLATVDVANTTSLENYKGLRDPVEEFLYAGSLIKVITPTQGSKSFFYEPNKYTSVVQRNTTTGDFSIAPVGSEKIGAGLRIKQIVEQYGEGSPDVVTNYTYGPGTLLGDIQYYWPSYKGKLLNGNSYTSTRFVTESLLPVSDNPGGGAISYSSVTQEQVGNGKTIYQYSDFATNGDENGVSIDAEKSPYSPFTSRSYERGLLKSIRTYDNSTPPIEISSEVFGYTVNPAFSTDFIRAVEARGITLFGSSEVNQIEGSAYKHYLHPYQRTKRTSSIRDKSVSTYLTTVEDYVYNNKPVPENDNQLKEMTLTNSSGEILLSKYKHPLDFQVNDGTPELTGLNALKSKHIYNVAITEEKSIKPVGQSQYSILSSSLNTFRVAGYPVLDAVYDLKISSKVTSTATTIGPSLLTLDPKMNREVKFDEYDSHGNLLQYTTSEGVPTTILYGYNYAYPVAQIKNATYATVKAVLSQSTIDLLNTSPGTDDQLRAKLLPLRSASTLDKALVTTYTYIPLVGMTSTTDPNNFSTYYEYDNLNRLKIIKDSNKNIVKTFSYNYQFK